MSMYDYFTGAQSWRDYVNNRDLARRIESSLVKVGSGVRVEVQATTRAVNQALSEGFGSVLDGLDGGMSQLSCDIRDVALGIADLRADFHLLMGEAIWRLELQSATLNSVLTALQSPLDTAARELRRRAEDAYRNGWYEEALADFLASETKNYQDFAVHRSIGNIYLYHLVDVPRALEYFLKAAKYAAPRDVRQAAEAHFLAAITAGLARDFRQAFAEASEATRLNPSFYEAHYYGAGFAALLSETRGTVAGIRAATAGDARYWSRCKNDPIFGSVKSTVDMECARLLDEERNRAAQELQSVRAFYTTVAKHMPSNAIGWFSATISECERQVAVDELNTVRTAVAKLSPAKCQLAEQGTAHAAARIKECTQDLARLESVPQSVVEAQKRLEDASTERDQVVSVRWALALIAPIGAAIGGAVGTLFDTTVGVLVAVGAIAAGLLVVNNANRSADAKFNAARTEFAAATQAAAREADQQRSWAERELVWMRELAQLCSTVMKTKTATA